MHFLALAVLCSVGIAVVFKYATKRGYPPFIVFAVNYLVATVGALIGSGGVLTPLQDQGMLLLSIGLGVLFIWCFHLLMVAVRKIGMVLPVTLMRLSAVLPTAGSMLVFLEIPSATQIAGIALAFVALPLSSRQRIHREELRTLFSGGFGWGLLLFFSYGLTDFLFKVQKEVFPVGNLYEVLVFIFGTALLLSVSTAIIRKERPSAAAVRTGALLGLFNMFAAYFFMSAIGVLPGVVVFPVNGIGVILLSTIIGVFFYKEQLSLKNYVALTLAVVALLLLY